jgi:aryl-alcohol dehydrogenase-like predicted oxidoreductase
VTTQPGFGTAHLMGRIGSRESTRLIHAALDCGIRHFDTARLYGLGDSEEVLGRALRNRPDAMIFTKVGRGNPRHSAVKAQIYAALRPVARARARLSGVVDQFAGPALETSRTSDFSLPAVKTSVETSLRLLQRDTLDGLLLHEATATDLSPELIGFMELLKTQGKIRQFGIASQQGALANLVRSWLPGDLLQQAGGPFVEPLGTHSDLQVVLHSIFGAKGQYLKPFQSWLAENSYRRDSLLRVASAESLKSIPSLLISYTSTRWYCKAVIFASASETHIEDNANAIRHHLSDEGMQAVTDTLAAYKGALKGGDEC